MEYDFTKTTQVCQRCKQGTNITQMSFFNNQMCCSRCIEIERAHPAFQAARDAELQAIKNGDFNFPGVGLPHDLFQWAKEVYV